MILISREVFLLVMLSFASVARVLCRNFQPTRSMTNKRSLSLSPAARQRDNMPSKSLAVEAPANNVSAVVQYLDPPDKSESDRKSYRSIVLSNGLKALLVSDPSEDEGDKTKPNPDETLETESETSIAGSNETDANEENGEKLAAAALCIGVGSFSDPKNIQGLAHFLEHMIFMGSTKYPAENEYDAYINKCGGSDNAMTDVEETTFHFEIDEEYLDGAVDRFSNLFTSPLMLRESMCRERDAVDSEFKTSINSDESRREQLFAHLGNDDHPSNLFTWGNLKTLKNTVTDDELYEQVHKFQQRHYSAHRMTFAIQARMTLDELEELTVKYLSNIPSNNLPEDDFSQYNEKNAFKREFYSKVLFIKPKSNICRLDVTWCLPTVLKKYKCKALDYLSYLFGYEGKNSLISYLKKNMWALDIHTGASYGAEKNSLYTLFSVSVNMTDLGFNHVDEILKAIFSYIKLLQDEGPNRPLFDELMNIEANSFKFKKEKEAVDNVEELVVNMRYYPSKDIMTGSELYFEYNEIEIKEAIEQLNEKKFNIMISSKKNYDGVVYDKVEKWFGTEYGELDFPDRWNELWEGANAMPDLKLPNINPYISTNFTVLYHNGHNQVTPYPVKVLDDDLCELWYKQDNKFFLPLAIMQFYFITPLTQTSAFNATLQTLFTSVLRFQIAEDLYPAEIAGLDYELYSSEKGIVLKVEGYNEKLSIIVDEVTKGMKKFESKLSEPIFDAIKNKLMKSYYNEIISASKLNKNTRLKLVQEVHWSTVERFNLLKSITVADLKTYSQILFKEIKIQSLIQGNILQDEALSVMKTVLKNLDCGSIKNKSVIEARANQIPLGDHYMSMNSFRLLDVNSVITNFYQAGPVTPDLTTKFELLMMLMEEPLFDMLRTKEQLSYDLYATFRDNFGILGYSITIHSQENKFNREYIDNRIEFFTKKFVEILEEMTEEHFTMVQNSLMKRKMTIDTELKNEVSRNWAEITTNEYIFDRDKREIEYIKNLTQEKIIEFYKKIMFDPKHRRKLSVQVVGNEKEAPENEPAVEEDLERTFKLEFIVPPAPSNASIYIDDLEKFKKGLFTYPVTKTKFD